MKKIALENFGPIRSATVQFGDLTVLVGPQATGKSLFVQLVKALRDSASIRANLKSYGFEWLGSADPCFEFCSIYFGGGLGRIVRAETTITRDGKPVEFKASVVKPPPRARAVERTFVIPAQRVLVLQDGWPRPFMAYSEGDPYCMRQFSDSLRLLMGRDWGGGDAIFPQSNRMKSELRAVINEAIYIGAKLVLERGQRKRIVLLRESGEAPLPFSAWSAGQREFTPLLLGLYWLMPAANRARRRQIDTVIIEEPEMGLHPQAIVGFGLLVLELLHRGYHVVLSTHSPVVLDLVWAIRSLQADSARALEALPRVFGLQRCTSAVHDVFTSALKKEYRTYFFDRQTNSDEVVVRDISELSPDDEDSAVAGWGGLSGLSGKIADVVGNALGPQNASLS